MQRYLICSINYESKLVTFLVVVKYPVIQCVIIYFYFHSKYLIHRLYMFFEFKLLKYSLR